MLFRSIYGFFFTARICHQIVLGVPDKDLIVQLGSRARADAGLFCVRRWHAQGFELGNPRRGVEVSGPRNRGEDFWFHPPLNRDWGTATSCSRAPVTGNDCLGARTPHTLASVSTLAARSGAAPVVWHGECQAHSTLDLPLGDRRWRCDRSRQGGSQQRQASNDWRIADGSVRRSPHHFVKYLRGNHEDYFIHIPWTLV